MTYRNAQAKNIGNDEGDVYKFFQMKLSNLVQKNGGNHSFNWKTFECSDAVAPHSLGAKTNLKLTSDNFDITQCEKSFISALIRIRIKLNQALTLTADTNNLLRIFVGLKDAAEIFGQTETLCDNVSLLNHTNDAVREQFAYNMIMTRAQKETRKFSHSPWANVSEMDPSVCGVYVNLADIADGLEHEYQFEINIPYQDMLKYQALLLYPNTICGELTEQVYTTTDAFVWAPVDPDAVKDRLEKQTGASIEDDFSGSVVDITRKFTQINNQSKIPVSYVAAVSPATGKVLTTGSCSLSITSGQVMYMRTNIAGFNVKPEVLSSIHSLLSERPIIVPSQDLERRPYQQSALANGFDGTIDAVLQSTTSITVMFPRRTTDTTCFENVMYQNVSLNVNKIQYPDTPFTTTDSRFYQMQLVANELDGTLEPTQEFEDSFTQPLNDPDSGDRYTGCRTDGTSFCMNFQLERSNAGYVFDGVDTGHATVPITLRGSPIYSGDNDTYYIPDSSQPSVHPPPAELWICRDTCFIMAPKEKGGFQYMGPNVPAGFD